jgi:hypothetical protein
MKPIERGLPVCCGVPRAEGPPGGHCVNRIVNRNLHFATLVRR